MCKTPSTSPFVYVPFVEPPEWCQVTKAGHGQCCRKHGHDGEHWF